MYYNNFTDWLASNTHQAHKIIERRIKNAEDQENLESTILWCEHEIENNHKMLGWLESAVKEVCNEEQYQQIQKLYMTFMHNDFITNCPWGKEMFEKGQIDAASSKFIMFPNKDKE